MRRGAVSGKRQVLLPAFVLFQLSDLPFHAPQGISALLASSSQFKQGSGIQTQILTGGQPAG